MLAGINEGDFGLQGAAGGALAHSYPLYVCQAHADFGRWTRPGQQPPVQAER